MERAGPKRYGVWSAKQAWRCANVWTQRHFHRRNGLVLSPEKGVHAMRIPGVALAQLIVFLDE